MKLPYKPVVQKQLNNPFRRQPLKDRIWLREYLTRMQCHIGQLSNSRDPKERLIWQAMIEPLEDFGKSEWNGYALNTGLSALGGAIGKMFDGDLSDKQWNNIKDIVNVMVKQYPDKYEPIEWINESKTANKNTLFEF